MTRTADAQDAPAPYGSSLLLSQLLRRADHTLTAIRSVRDKSRAAVGVGGISLSVGLTVAASAELPGWTRITSGGAILLFVAVSGIALMIDWPWRINVTPNLIELRELVEGRAWSEDWLALWTAREYADKVNEPNFKLMERLASMSRWQLVLLSLETTLVALTVVSGFD